MKNQLFTLAAVLTASAALTGCSSEQLVENQKVEPAVQTAVQTYQLQIGARKSSDGLTRALEESGSQLLAKWSTDDKVFAYINDAAADGDAIELTPSTSGTNNTILTGSLTKSGGFTTSDVIHLYYLKKKSAYDSRTYTGQDGDLDKIASDYDYATADVNILAVTPTGNDNILRTSDATFTHLQAITKFTVKKKADDSDFDITPIDIKESGLGTLTVTPGSAAHEIWVAMPGRASTASAASKTYKFEATSESKLYGVSKAVDLVNDHYYTATLTMGRDAQKLTLTGVLASQPYNGSAVNVSTVTSGDATPEDLTTASYDVAYKKWNATTSSWDDCDAADVKAAGKYKVVVTGKGDFEGTTEQEFDITKTSTTDVNAAITAGTIADGTTITQDAATKTTDIITGNILGMTVADIKALSSPNGITLGTLTPSGDWATINDAGQLVTTGGGIVEVTISLPATDDRDAGSVTRKVYVKQSGIGGNLGDPSTGTSW